MKYYNNMIVQDTFDSVISKTETALQKEGFGVLTRIDVQETLKKKIDKDFKKYIILGACNPPYAYDALLAEEKIGTMLPCNIVVIEQEKLKIEVAAIDPLMSMEAVANKDLFKIAIRINEKLKRVINSLT